MMLELAEGGASVQELYYLAVPTGDGGYQQVRADLLDDLSDADFEALNQFTEQMRQEQNGMGFWIFSKGGRERMKQRREARQERREEKHSAKLAKRTAKANLIQARADGKVPTGIQTLVSGVKDFITGGASPEPGLPIDVTGGVTIATPPPEKSTLQKILPWAAGFLVVGGIIYYFTR